MAFRLIQLMDECRQGTTIKSIHSYYTLSSLTNHNLLAIFTSKFIFKLCFYGLGNIMCKSPLLSSPRHTNSQFHLACLLIFHVDSHARNFYVNKPHVWGGLQAMSPKGEAYGGRLGKRTHFPISLVFLFLFQRAN